MEDRLTIYIKSITRAKARNYSQFCLSMTSTAILGYRKDTKMVFHHGPFRIFRISPDVAQSVESQDFDPQVAVSHLLCDTNFFKKSSFIATRL